MKLSKLIIVVAVAASAIGTVPHAFSTYQLLLGALTGLGAFDFFLRERALLAALRPIRLNR
jgi:hypothetical protein